MGKVTTSCLSCCPHNSDIVAVGETKGLIYIVDLRRTGNILYKLRGHNKDITSLSWCPAATNVLENNEKKDFLLASGAKDK